MTYDFRELAIVRGLLTSPQSCDWFTGMGIGWELFEDKRCQIIAAWALGGCRGTPPMVADAVVAVRGEAFWVDLGPTVAKQAQDMPSVEWKPEWGLRDVQRYSRELAGRWLPRYLTDLAAYVKAQDGNADRVAKSNGHHRRVLAFIAGEGL